MGVKQVGRGFTLIEVLVAMAITALISAVAYGALSSALSAAESVRSATVRSHDINQTLTVLSRDIRQVVNRSIIDEFNQPAPALSGGLLSRYPLTLTRAGWHNSTGAPRSTLQRVRWWIEEDVLWRAHFPVLDRTPGTEPIETAMLDDVEGFEVRFLPTIVDLKSDRDDVIDDRDWRDNWIADVSQPDLELPIPAAVEIVLQLAGLGEVRRLYVLPSS
ncbi:type II secretion system minor pseudopilin GspJ [Luminiphilus sp.]|nr:type II secretion system minor pseudopilin GspJ [Luminiphilus sp.]MDB2642885.1 type II secretion system minor pseudopilin GspJ [Luminiphilus sp.]